MFCVQNAEKGGYAVGAFNVYNLEGVEAVVAAAEEEQSPAILQVRISQFRRWIFWLGWLRNILYDCVHDLR